MVNPNILEDIEQQPVIESFDNPITEEEVDKALKNTKSGKSPGPDSILPEVLVHGDSRLKSLFNSAFQLLLD